MHRYTCEYFFIIALMENMSWYWKICNRILIGNAVVFPNVFSKSDVKRMQQNRVLVKKKYRPASVGRHFRRYSILSLGIINPFFPTVPTCTVRETASLGIMGAPRVPPLNPSETIVLSEHYHYYTNLTRNMNRGLMVDRNDKSLYDRKTSVIYFRAITLCTHR